MGLVFLSGFISELDARTQAAPWKWAGDTKVKEAQAAAKDLEELEVFPEVKEEEGQERQVHGWGPSKGQNQQRKCNGIRGEAGKNTGSTPATAPYSLGYEEAKEFGG